LSTSFWCAINHGGIMRVLTCEESLRHVAWWRACDGKSRKGCQVFFVTTT